MMLNDRQGNFKELLKYHVHSDSEIMSQKETILTEVMYVQFKSDIFENILHSEERENHGISNNIIKLLNFNE